MSDESKTKRQLIEELVLLRDELNKLKGVDLGGERLRCSKHLASGLAHNFNNILTPIVGYTQVGMNAFPSDQKLVKYLSEISKAAERASYLTRLLLAFAGREIRKPVDSDINALIVAMRTELDCLVKPGVEIVLELDSTAQHVQIDPRQFKQVIANLVTNASEAISLETGTITIQTLAMPSTLPLLDHDGLNDRVRISVLDTGIGISDEVRDHVFEPFFTTQPPWEKLGMGLSVCYGIVMQNGGEITFHSGDTGGTRFDVVLPAARSARPARDCDSAEPEADNLSHVLVLESDTSIMDLTARVLREHGYSVLRAHSLAEFEAVAHCEVLTLIECVLTSIVKPFDAPTGIEDAVRSAFPGARVIHVNSNGVADGAPRRFDPVRILDLLRS